jgi:hypothetical protein
MSVTKYVAAWVVPMLALSLHAGHARADEHMVLVDTIDVGGNGLGAFDISFVDPKRGLYVLSDRTNASVDFFNPKDDTFIGRVGGFKGVVLTNGVANNNLSGPDGVLITADNQVWAGDGDSTVKVIDIAKFQVVDTISTGGSYPRRREQCGYATFPHPDQHGHAPDPEKDRVRWDQRDTRRD